MSGHYHVMARGDRREPIVRDDGDRGRRVRPPGMDCERAGWRAPAWVLMTDHYHLLIATPVPNLVAGRRRLQTTWTARLRRRHGLSGHVCGGRYKAVLVEGEAPRPAARAWVPHGRDLRKYWRQLEQLSRVVP